MSLTTLRWLLTPLAALAAWLAAFVTGVWWNDLTARLWCGREALLDYTCALPRWFVRINVAAFVAVAAAGVVAAPWIVAPRKSATVAWTFFSLGACAALALAWFDLPDLFSALASGVATASFLARRSKR